MGVTILWSPIGRVTGNTQLLILTECGLIMYIGVMPPRPWSAGCIERSGCPYVRPSVAQVKIFVQGRISRTINGRKLIFEPLHEKTVFRNFRPGKTQTGLFSYRD